MNAPHDEKWIERARALLDQSTQTLDAATLSRLNRARQAALAERRTAVRRRSIGFGLAGAAAVALMIAIGLRHRLDAPDAAPVEMGLQAMDDVDVLTNDDDAPELYENLDFYAWLGNASARSGDKNG